MHIQSEIEQNINLLQLRFIHDMRSDMIQLDDYIELKCNIDALILTICDCFKPQMIDNEEFMKIDNIITINITDIYMIVNYTSDNVYVKEKLLFNVYKYMYIFEFYEYFEISFNLKKIAEIIDDL